MLGRRLAHYEILSVLGKGGMGEVYRARDARLGREVALKVLPPEAAAQPELLRRFLREARALAALDHPNIVAVHSVEEADGRHFLTMGLVEGASLDGEIPPGGMAASRWLDVARAIAKGLAAAHAKGVIHRDLKPANVMITAGGEAKLVDFGIAKREGFGEEEPSTLTLTRAGTALGTVPYMSPEQLAGRPVDARSDIFSLGVVLYEMASGRRPFAGESRAEVIGGILHVDPPPPTGPCLGLSSDVERLILRCLAKDPDARYPGARELLEDLERLVAPESGARGIARLAGRASADDPGLRLPDVSRPSLAILPFVNLSGDPEQDPLADGLCFDLNADLVKLSGLFLLGGSSTAAYKGRSVDPRLVGRELGVRHVLEGGVRRAGTRIRITVRLVDTESGGPVWAEHYDREMEDLFALQDEVNARIFEELDVQLLHGEASRLIGSTIRDPKARDLYYRAIPLGFAPRLEALQEARRLLAEVERIEPGRSIVASNLGWTHYMESAYGLASDPARSIEEAATCAEQAIERGDAGGMGYMLKAAILLMRRDHDAALDAGRAALDRRPGCPWAYAVLGAIHNYAGEPRRAIHLAMGAMRRSPFVPHLFPAVLATAYYLAQEPDAAIASARRALDIDLDGLDALVILAAGLVAAGRHGEAPEVSAAVRRLKPDFSLDAYRERQPYRDPKVLEGLVADLRSAGL